MKINKCKLFSVFSLIALSMAFSVFSSVPSYASSAYDYVIKPSATSLSVTNSQLPQSCNTSHGSGLESTWFGSYINNRSNWNPALADSYYDQVASAFDNALNRGRGWAVVQRTLGDGGSQWSGLPAGSGDKFIEIDVSSSDDAVFSDDYGSSQLKVNASTYQIFITYTNIADGSCDVGVSGVVSASSAYLQQSAYDASHEQPLFINYNITYPDGYEGSIPASSFDVFTPPEFKLHYEVDDKHVKVTNSSSGILDTPEGSPDIACSLKAIQAFDDFPTAYESNTTYCSKTFEFDVDSYGKYNIALKYWRFVGSRDDGISSDDYIYLGEATTSIFINGTKFSGGADSLGSTEICDAMGNCHPTDGSYMPCLAWGQPIVQTDLTQPALINPISCFSDFGSFVNSLSFGVVNLGNFQVNPNQCRQLVIIDDWILKPDITLCAKVPSYVRDVVTPIVTMVLSIFILTWLVNRGDRYGV